MLKCAAKLIALLMVVITIASFVIVHLLTIRTFESARLTASGAYTYYFAYGSNMPARYLNNVRHIDVYDSAAGLLVDHEVQFFASGLPFLEPAFARLIAAEGRNAFGVLHRIDTDSLSSIICSEGKNYAMVERDVRRLDNGANIRAWTLVGKPTAEAVPSRRYLDLLVEGARAHSLPAAYNEELAKLDGAYTPLLSELMGVVIYARVMMQAVNPDARCGAKAS